MPEQVGYVMFSATTTFESSTSSRFVLFYFSARGQFFSKSAQVIHLSTTHIINQFLPEKDDRSRRNALLLVVGWLYLVASPRSFVLSTRLNILLQPLIHGFNSYRSCRLEQHKVRVGLNDQWPATEPYTFVEEIWLNHTYCILSHRILFFRFLDFLSPCRFELYGIKRVRSSIHCTWWLDRL